MFIKDAKNDFTLKMIDFNTFTNMPKNVENLGKLIVAKGFKKLPKFNISPNLVTLIECDQLL